MNSGFADFAFSKVEGKPRVIPDVSLRPPYEQVYAHMQTTPK